jgi:predicted Fe-Mo cluster-binding NifX family protein
LVLIHRKIFGVIMKVAIAKDGDEVSGHFGQCAEYALFTIQDTTITKKEILKSPGHEPGRLPALLAQHHVTHVLAGGMGPKAVDLFCANNIEVFLGISGKIDSVIQDFIAGKVIPGQSSCHHTHECGE